MEAVLRRLDRLTQEEARTTAAQSLEVIHGLMKNLQVIMDGMWLFFFLRWLPSSEPYRSFRWKGLHK